MDANDLKKLMAMAGAPEPGYSIEFESISSLTYNGKKIDPLTITMIHDLTGQLFYHASYNAPKEILGLKKSDQGKGILQWSKPNGILIPVPEGKLELVKINK